VSASPFLLRLSRGCALGEEDTAFVEHMTRNRAELPGERLLVAEGDRPHAVHVVLDGLACRYKILPDGRRQILGFLVPGDSGDFDVLLLPRVDHSLATLAPSLIATVSRQDVEMAFAERPRLATALRLAVLQDVAVLREWLVNVGRRNAYERMAHLLWELYVRHALVGKVADHGFRLPLTQSDLADALGLSTVYVNKTITRLRASGIIETDRRQIRILQPDELRAIAGFDGSYLQHGARSSRPPARLRSAASK
jgi:CRP-like cAMP-binding protein